MSLRRGILATVLVAGLGATGCSGGGQTAFPVEDESGCSVMDQMEGLGPADPSPLESAAGRGDLERVEQLLGQGTDPHDGVYVSPLMAVVDDEEPSILAGEVAQALLDHGADVDFGGMCGSDQTPLHRAAMRDSAALVRLLLAAGADPCREVSDPAVFRGMTALDIALDRGNAAAATELQEASSTCG